MGRAGAPRLPHVDLGAGRERFRKLSLAQVNSRIEELKAG